MNVALMGNDKGIQVFTLIRLLAIALAGCTSSEASDPPAIDQTIPGVTTWGHYSGEPVTRWSPDGRNMILVTELRYTDPKGEVWVAPAGSVTDGASIPRYLWSLMGGPFEGQYRNASVLHDAAYAEKKRPWQDCDRMFYHAMRCSGVNAVEAKTMFYAVYKFAHHWKFPIKRAKPVKFEGQLVARAEPIPRAIPVNPTEINEARDWISNTDPTLEQIEQRAQTEAAAAPPQSTPTPDTPTPSPPDTPTPSPTDTPTPTPTPTSASLDFIAAGGAGRPVPMVMELLQRCYPRWLALDS